MAKRDGHARDKDDRHLDKCPKCGTIECQRLKEMERGFEEHRRWMAGWEICECGHSRFQHETKKSPFHSGWRDHGGCPCRKFVKAKERKCPMTKNLGMGCSEGESANENSYNKQCRSEANALARLALRRMLDMTD